MDGMGNTSNTAVSLHLGPCLLPLLQPVRHCLHSFLSDVDAARLMQTSRSTTIDLLTGFAFISHVFIPQDAAQLKRTIALYNDYNIRILRMSLSDKWNERLLDATTVRPLLPASLQALSLGQHDGLVMKRMLGRGAAYAALDGGEERHNESEGRGAEAAPEAGQEGEFRRLVRLVDAREMDLLRLHDVSWRVLRYAGCIGDFSQPLTPGALPHGLRFLQFHDRYNLPLQAGSLPSTLETLQLGFEFDQPFTAGHLPASLRHLVLGHGYDQQLMPGVLPAGLLRLAIGAKFDHPLPVGVLPPQLQQISLGGRFRRSIGTGTFPSTLTHIRLSFAYNEPLHASSLPHGLVHLNLGERYNLPLAPGVLPDTLCEIAFGIEFAQPLQRGSLPDGLAVIGFHKYSAYPHAFLPGIIPASVVAISMGTGYEEELVVGGIPSTVRWIRLPRAYADTNLSGVLSPSTRVVYWEM